MTKTKNTKRRDLYQEVTDRVVAALEAGTCPWRRPWSTTAGDPTAQVSLTTGKAYRGMNPLLLGLTQMERGYEVGLWLTFKQAKKLGGTIRKGEKSTAVVFWKFLEGIDEETGKLRKFPMLRHFNVFNIEQADLPEGKLEELREKHGLGQAAEPLPALAGADDLHARVAGYTDRLQGGLKWGGNQACYSPAFDGVRMPKPESFESLESYCSTLFHELGHSTGHESRLNRDFGGFGSHAYSREELVAEMTASFLRAFTGIDCDDERNMSAAYIANWRKALKDDPKALVWAAGKAQHAADFILDACAGTLAAPAQAA